MNIGDNYETDNSNSNIVMEELDGDADNENSATLGQEISISGNTDNSNTLFSNTFAAGSSTTSHGGLRVNTLRDQKVQESSKKVVFSSKNAVEMWYNLKFLELLVFVCFRRVFTLILMEVPIYRSFKNK